VHHMFPYKRHTANEEALDQNVHMKSDCGLQRISY
jgi:hypothetical protein